MNSRIEQLLAFVNEDPTDPFNLYALALEYQKFDVSGAMSLFHRLLTEHPRYVPTYYQLAKLHEHEGNKERALETYARGIEVAAQANDRKAVLELRAAQNELSFEE